MRRVRIPAVGAAALVVMFVAAPSAFAITTVTAEAPAVGTTTLDDVTGTYYDAGPTRFLDTRRDGSRRPLAGGSTTSLQITGRATSNILGIPETGVSAVVLNLTAVATTSPGYLTVFSSDVSRPTASSLNFPAHWTGANMVTVPVGADGRIKIYNYGGTSHAVVDVLGWYAQNNDVQWVSGTGSLFEPATDSGDPTRRFDSRLAGDGAYFGGDSVVFTDEWVDEATASSISAYTVNITAVGATKPGVLTARAGGAAKKPLTSTVNYEPGVIAPNMAIVPAGHYSPGVTGFSVENASSGSVHFVVDIIGYYARDAVGLRFTPRPTTRFLDTRKAIGLSGPFLGRQARTVDAAAVSSNDSYYVVGNTTGVAPSKQTYLTGWSGDGPRPSASTLNVAPCLTRSVSMYAPLSASAPTFTVYNASGSMDVVMDAAGTLDVYRPAPPAGGALLRQGTGNGARKARMPVHATPQASTAKRT